MMPCTGAKTLQCRILGEKKMEPGAALTTPIIVLRSPNLAPSYKCDEQQKIRGGKCGGIFQT
jgi:hypothetical protein